MDATQLFPAAGNYPKLPEPQYRPYLGAISLIVAIGAVVAAVMGSCALLGFPSVSYISDPAAITMTAVGWVGTIAFAIIAFYSLVGHVGHIDRCRAFVRDCQKGHIRNDFMFGEPHYEKCFGSPDEGPTQVAPPLAPPKVLRDELEKTCPFSNHSDIKVKHTHMALLCRGPLTTDVLNEKLKEKNVLFWPLPDDGSNAPPEVELSAEKITDIYPSSSCFWILMTRSIVPEPQGSHDNKHMSPSQQEEFLTKMGYHVPSLFELVYAFTAEYLTSEQSLSYKSDYNTYGSRCYTKDKLFGTCFFDPYFVNADKRIGGFTIATETNDKPHGVVAVKRFFYSNS